MKERTFGEDNFRFYSMGRAKGQAIAVDSIAEAAAVEANDTCTMRTRSSFTYENVTIEIDVSVKTLFKSTGGIITIIIFLAEYCM